MLMYIYSLEQYTLTPSCIIGLAALASSCSREDLSLAKSFKYGSNSSNFHLGRTENNKPCYASEKLRQWAYLKRMNGYEFYL